jgi:hypothetical protein
MTSTHNILIGILAILALAVTDIPVHSSYFRVRSSPLHGALSAPDE